MKIERGSMDVVRRISKDAGVENDPRAVGKIKRFRKDDLEAFERFYEEVDKINKSRIKLVDFITDAGVENLTDAEIICAYPLLESNDRFILDARSFCSAFEAEAEKRGLRLNVSLVPPVHEMSLFKTLSHDRFGFYLVLHGGYFHKSEKKQRDVQWRSGKAVLDWARLSGTI